MKTIHRPTITPRFQALLELPSRSMSRPLDMALAIFLFLVLASSPLQAAAQHDPFEKMNRVTYSFNAGVDRAIIKPLATGYVRYTPEVAKTGVGNFFSNLEDIKVLINDIAQLRLRQATRDLGRLALNSTVGVAGLLDVAAPLGLEKNRQDFGKTLAHWGVGSGPYIVLPLLGPSTARDALGLGVDTLADPIPSVDDVATRNGLLATKSTDLRAGYLPFDDLVIGDEYLFVRDIYLQSRKHATTATYVEMVFEDF